MSAIYDYERLGGFCRLVAKPAGPTRLRQVLKACVHMIAFRNSSRDSSPSISEGRLSHVSSFSPRREDMFGPSGLSRRSSQEASQSTITQRPRLLARANTFHPILPVQSKAQILATPRMSPPQEYPSSPGDTTITVGGGGTLLKASIGTLEQRGQVRILVVEDNQILRDLLLKWLKVRGYDYRDAVDGRQGVTVFEREEHFDVVLLDLSMPVLDGVSAAGEIREIEANRLKKHLESNNPGLPPRPAKILALTGMSSLEDKRRAFEAGVDGYLVKPVAFKTLDAMFHQLGVS